MGKSIFEGIKIVEFAAFAAGPIVGKHLADLGAQVIHVESMARPDGFRQNYPPFKDNKPGLNRALAFALWNNNKYGITLNLKAPGALEVAKKIVQWADVLIENFTPNTMSRLGLGYNQLREIKPDLIMLSTCNQGQTGPHASHPGFGSQLTSLSGFTYLTGYPDGPPNILYGPYIDFIGGGYGVIAVVAALEHRRRTGEGQYIDLAQYEAGIQFVAPAILDFNINGRIMSREGNHHPYAAPHGAFPCKGKDNWCVISVYSDEEWKSLCSLVNPDLAQDHRFSSIVERKRNEDELDPIIRKWTSQKSAREIMEILQEAGIHAGVIYKMEDIFSDPQLILRHFWWELDHPEIGRHYCEAQPFLFSETPIHLNHPAPCIGQHNREVYVDMLKFTEAEYQALVETGVID